MKPADLWNWNGRVSRFAYFLTGLLAFLVKHSFDTLLAYHFGLRWHLWNDWAPVDRLPTFNASGDPPAHFLMLLFATAIPFIWIGVVMTVNRLRDAAQPSWLVLLFFVPIVNLLLFVALCALPAQPSARFVSPTDSLVWGIQSRAGSAALAALVAGFIGMSITWIDLRFHRLPCRGDCPFVWAFLIPLKLVSMAKVLPPTVSAAFPAAALRSQSLFGSPESTLPSLSPTSQCS